MIKYLAMSSTPLKRLQAIRATFTSSSANLRNVNRTELTPVSFLRRSATIFPNRVAAMLDGKEICYRHFEVSVLRFAASLKQHFAIKTGDRVGLLCRNIPIMLEAHFAVPTLRGIIVAINTRLTHEDVAYISEHSGCKLIIYELEFKPLLKSVPAACVSVEDFLYSEDTNLSWDDFPYNEGNEEDIISISYTSGTTGRPKGVMATYRGAVLASLNNVIEMGFKRDSCYLWVLPMFHCNGWCFPWSVVAVGGANILLPHAEPDKIWHLFMHSGVTHYCGVPTIQLALCHHPAAAPLPQKIVAMIAGSPPSPALLSKMESLGLEPIHTYGLTETYGPSTSIAPNQATDPATRYRLMARQGYAYLLADPVRVVDSNMRDVPRDGVTVGEVVFRGNLVMKGYYNDPNATSEAFRGGWFHTGDLAVMERDGAIVIQDREKDIIISGGENISTVEIEKMLSNHPAIKEVAVVSSPHPRWGETPKAFIVLTNEAASKALEPLRSEILTYARDRLAHFKCPTKITFLDELPKTGTGKIQKFVLKQQEWENFKNKRSAL